MQIVNVDQRKIIIYLISILWRAIESDHKKFCNLKKLNIEPVINNLFRESVRSMSMPKNKFFSVRISKLVTQINEFRDMKLNFISNFSVKAVEQGRIRFLIIFESYCFEIFLHTRPTDQLTGLGILKTNKRILKLPYIEAFSIPELQQSLIEMIEAHKNG